MAASAAPDSVTPSTPPRRPKRSTLRNSVHRSYGDLTAAAATVSSSPLGGLPRSSSWGGDHSMTASTDHSSDMLPSWEGGVLASPPKTSSFSGTPCAQSSLPRPASAHVRASRSWRKPVPSMLGSDEGHLSVDASVVTHNSLGTAPLSGGAPANGTSTSASQARRASRSTYDFGSFEDSPDSPLPMPRRPRGQSVSSLSTMSMLSAASNQSRPYTLPVDPPHHHGDSPPPSPPGTPSPPSSSYHAYNQYNASSRSHSHPASMAGSINSHAPFFGGLPRYSLIDLPATSSERNLTETAQGRRSRTREMPALAYGAEPDMNESLPRYEKQSITEPMTLACTLWQYGFGFPPLWWFGMCILWSPLKYEDDDNDPEKKQTVQEMLLIVRETELKYARRCAIAGSIFGAALLLLVIVLCAVLIPRN